MIRIGLVNIDVSHPKTFGNYMMQSDRARYVAVFNDGFRGDDEVEAFIKDYEVEKRCSSVEELAEYADVGFIQGCNWDKHIEYAMPFINRNKPVFIDKPIVGNLKDCETIERLVKEGKVIIGSSSVRYAYEITDFLAKPEEERGKIVNVFGTSGVDEFNYGVHVVEAIGGLMGTGAHSAKFIGRSEIDGKICESFYVKFTNGSSALYNTFQGLWMPFDLTIMTTKGTFQFQIDTKKIYYSIIDNICDFIEGGKNKLASITELTESIKIMLAARISRENGGAEVKLSDIPLEDKGYDGYAFEKTYSANAKKIYLK